MKLAVLGGVAAICAATALVAAQTPTPTEQTVIGCLRGEGTAQAPWVLAGVVIPPPAQAGGRGGGGGRHGASDAGTVSGRAADDFGWECGAVTEAQVTT